MFLIGKFKPPDPPKDDDLVQLELNRWEKNPIDFTVKNPIDYNSSSIKLGYLRIDSIFDLKKHLFCAHNYINFDILILKKNILILQLMDLLNL